MTKKCYKCGQDKPEMEFVVVKGFIRGECRKCYNLRKNKWRKENPKQWREIILKHKYGLSAQQHEEMLLLQGGRCALCLRGDIKLCIDHDHSSGQVRGLICNMCNSYLGIINDSVEVLKRAIEYLQKFGS